MILPRIRRVFSGLIHIGEVKLQPMKTPSAGIFYHDYKYGTDDNKRTDS